MQQGTCYGPSVNCLITGLSAGAEAGANDVDDGITSIQSPVIALPAGASLRLSFRYYVGFMSNATSADFFRVRVVGANGTATTVFTRSANSSNVAGVWTSQSVSLSAYAGQNVRIRFEAGDVSLDQPRRSRCGRRCDIEAVAFSCQLPSQISPA